MRLEDLTLPGVIYRGTVATPNTEVQTRFQIVDGVLFHESSGWSWDGTEQNFWVDAVPLFRVNALSDVRLDA